MQRNLIIVKNNLIGFGSGVVFFLSIGTIYMAVDALKRSLNSILQLEVTNSWLKDSVYN